MNALFLCIIRSRIFSIPEWINMERTEIQWVVPQTWPLASGVPNLVSNLLFPTISRSEV